MRWNRVAVLSLLVGLSVSPASFAEPAAAPSAAEPSGSAEAPPTGAAEPSPEEVKARMKAFEDSLGFRTGKVSLAKGKAELNVPEGFRYLGPESANKVLQAWGNPPDAGTEGMLFTKELGQFDDDSWAVVIQYSDEGHVSDDDAEDLDFDDLLKEMQKASTESNGERTKQGLETVALLGWAEPPHYDQATHKVYWAKHLKFGSSQDDTLNYAIRVLGREGVLELNAVAGMQQLGMVKQRMREVLGFAEFTHGNTYADFDESRDKLAEYGIGALVAGGLAVKTGIFKGLLAVLLASKKLIVAGVVAAGAGLKTFLNRLRGKSDASASSDAA